MAKSNDKETATDTSSTRSLRAPRRARPQPPADMIARANEIELRAWEMDQDRRERELEEARSKYPPGTKLYVSTARGISRRGRAGISFGDKGRTEVEVIDVDEDTLAKIRTLDQNAIERLHKGEAVAGLDEDLDARTVTRIRSGGNYVTPLGAKAIAEDDGLNVHSSAAKDEAGGQADAGELERLRAENAKLREENARLKRNASNPAAPQRLASGTSGEFGGDDSKPGTGKQ
jgi:hypothetical protein